jgi:heme/copper-type cytochrome/quinol oxidase subunit 2
MSKTVPARSENGSRMIWIQLLAGPVIWSVHFILVYMLTEAICRVAGQGFRLAGIHGLTLIVIVLTVLALVATVLFAVRSYRSWRGLSRNHRLKDELQESSNWFVGPEEFMYFSGFLLSVLFAVTILMVGIPALFLQPC